MLFGKIFYMIHRTISVIFLRDTIRDYVCLCHQQSWRDRIPQEHDLFYRKPGTRNKHIRKRHCNRC